MPFQPEIGTFVAEYLLLLLREEFCIRKNIFSSINQA